MKKIIYTLSAIAMGSVLTSCSKDFTETQFFQEEQATPLASVEQLSSFVNGTYVKMRDFDYYGAYYRAFAEVRSDEMYNIQRTDRLRETANYTLVSTDRDPKNTWSSIYKVVTNANIVITASDNLPWGESNDALETTNKVKNLKAQAYTIRALAFFDLLRLYGQKYAGGSLGVPLALTYDPNATSERTTIAQTEAQIEADFNKASTLFQEIASSQGKTLAQTVSTADRVSITPYALKALQARYYLYKENYDKVAELSQEIIDSHLYSVISATDLASSFSKPNTTNSLFEVAVGLSGTLGASSYDYLMNPGGYGQIAVLSTTVSLYETGDVRKGFFRTNRGHSYVASKFADLQGRSNIKIVRYEEVLLDAVEAYIQKGDATNALTYYNQLRTNRGLTAATAVTLADLKKERARELLGEGFRYWDLLRWGDAVPQTKKDGTVETTRTVPNNLLVFPIPQNEIEASNSHVTQNAGY